MNLANKFNAIINNILNLDYIRYENKNVLIPNIVIDEEKLKQSTMQKICRDQLKFKYKWDKFGTNDYLQLIEYISTQKKNWKFNSAELHKIFIMFERKFSKDKLRQKVMSLGIEYFFS